ncbi:uncharacterized protein BBA_01162 [Beauveria bassiana ARSEF 2860]|uniref:Uncharacterized protein n=1 Tax=Beauveria bassiana (strain ARSEF 2860) TaxID=655819 RepID=J5K1I1_BEAB2|nr:uncharacterized protein BBA_01162 [Beauveria bassiana ARSEF 2860]EJP70293.1 hypothetical protein BBA_01162 [Beauveria bassiana ARSEF 2860]
MKVSTTSFLLASLYGSALAAPVGGDLGGALESVTNTAGLGNVAPGNIVPGNDLAKGLTGAVGQPGSIVGRDAPIGGDIIGDVLQPVTGKDGLGNVIPGNAIPGNIAPVNDLTKGLTGAVGQPGSIVGRDGEQKASVVLPNYNFLATDHTADVNIKADATNVHARNLDAKAKGIVGQLAEADAKAKAQPFAKPPADVNLDAVIDTRHAEMTVESVAHQTVDTVAEQTTGAVADQTTGAAAEQTVDARNLDANAKGVVGQLVDNDVHAKVHPFANSPVDVNANALVDAHNVDAKPTGAVDKVTDAVASGVTLADNIAEPTGSVDSALQDTTGVDVTGGKVLPTGNL